MKIKTTLTVILLLAAGRAEAQSADGAIDVASDTALADDGSADTAVPDAALDAALDTKTDGVDASDSSDAEIDAKTGGDAAVGDGAADGSKAPLSDAGSPPDVRLFVHEDPGCSFGGAPGPHGWSLLAAGLIALVGRARRRSNPRR